MSVKRNKTTITAELGKQELFNTKVNNYKEKSS